MFNKKNNFIFILISLLSFSLALEKLKVKETWEKFEVYDNGNAYNYQDYVPSKFKASHNNTFTMCIPRIYNYEDMKRQKFLQHLLR